MAYPGWNFEIGDNNGGIPFDGVMANVKVPIWTLNNGTNPANLEVSTLTVNSYPAGNILLTHNVSSGIEFNAPLIFQRPATDINEPVESLQMMRSVAVPTKPVDGEYIAALKDNGTVYDDIAVAGLQIFGNQTIGSPACGYITCDGPNVVVNTGDGSLYTSSLIVSSLFAQTVVSTTTGTANSYTATLYLSTPILYTNTIQATGNIQAANISSLSVSTGTIQANNISTNYISTNDGYCSSLTVKTANISTAQISSLVAGQFGANRIDVTLLSSLTGDITFNLVSTLSLFGNVDVNLGLGNQIAGLIGGAASQGLGVGLGGAALITGATALVTGRTSGGVDPTVFQTVNGSTQLQFSTIGTATTNVFATTNSTDPLHTPGSTIYISSVVPAGSYCVRSVGDPLNIQNNASSIQMFGQWVPLIQNSPTLPSFTISTLNASTMTAKSAEFSTLGVSTILGQTRMSTILTTGNILSQNPSATLVWGSPGYQTILSQTSTVMGNARAGTLTVLGDTFAQQIFGLSGNFNTVTASNQINTSFITGSNWISTPQLTVSTINGLTFPTPIPSTLSASTINMTGNLIGLNAAGYITWPTNSGAPYSSTIIQASGITTNNINTAVISSVNTANFSTLNLTGNINTTNTLAAANFANINTSTITASTINTSSITSKGGSISTMNVSTLNGVAYPPPNFGIALPSTLYVSTIIQNGNFVNTNPNPYASWNTGGFPYPSTIIGGGFSGIQTNQIGAANVNSLNANITGNLQSQGTLFLGDAFGTSGGYITTRTPFAIQNFTNVNASTMNVTTITATNLNTSNLTTGSISTQSISTGQILAYGNNQMSTLTVSSISSFRASGNLTGGSNGTFYWGQTGVEQAYISTLNISGSNQTTAVFPRLVSRYNFRNNGDAQIGSNLVVGGTVEIGAAVVGSNSASFLGDITSGNVITARVLAATQTLTAPTFTTGNLNVQQIANISTGVVSSLFTQFINNQPYPPQSGVTGGTPSTMLASTVFINGGLQVSNGPNYIQTVNISSMSSVSVTGNVAVSSITGVSTINGIVYPPPFTPALPSTLYFSTVFVNGGLSNTGVAPIATTNLSATNISNVSFINGQVYPPPSGSTSIPSTLYASTVLVNGGQTISGPPLTFFNTSLSQVGGYITTTTGLMQMSVNPTAGAGFAITAGSNLLSTLMFVQADGRARFTSSMTVRDNIPVGTPSQAYIQTYITGSEAPSGSVITANVSTSIVNTSSIKVGNVKFQNDSGPNGLNIITSAYNRFADDNTLFYNEYYTNNTSSFFTFGTLNAPNSAYITAGNIQTYAPVVTPPSGQVITSTISTININTTNINSIPYSLTLTPVGAITIWAGGAETTTTQDFAVPTGWLACDGSIIYQLTYPALYSVIGTKYGGAPPIPNTAYLPDLTFAVPMGTPKKPFATTPSITDKYIAMTAQTWTTGYVPSNISTIQAWRISNVQGGTLNYGTRLNNVSAPGGVTFPQMYVSSILQFDGNPAGAGYIVVRSVDNVTPIPKIPITSTIDVTYAYGVIDSSVVGADSPYNLATYNIEGHPFTTRLQSRDEVAVHTHIQAQDHAGPGPANGLVGSQIDYSSLPANYLDGFLPNGDYINTSPLPISPVIAGTNNISTISTVAVSASNPPAENPINRAYQTAPNFLNMVYIIKY